MENIFEKIVQDIQNLQQIAQIAAAPETKKTDPAWLSCYKRGVDAAYRKTFAKIDFLPEKTVALAKESAEKWGNVFCFGPAGSGKTMMASAMLAHALQKSDKARSVALVPVSEIAEETRWAKFGAEPGIIGHCERVAYLALDDLGQEPSHAMEFVTLVIDRRWRKNKPTIITTFLNPAQFCSKYSEMVLRRAIEKSAVFAMKKIEK